MPARTSGRIIPDPETVRNHLALVLTSPQFATAPRLSRFLSFVVGSTLEGKSSEIKESLIAVEVYGRPADYNPQVDSTVRVEAWRLRSKLREYYETAGPDVLLAIELPKGRYVPVFRERRTVQAAPELQLSEPQRVPNWRQLVAVVASIAVITGAVALTRWNGLETEKPDGKALKLYSRAWELLRHYRTEDGRILAVEESVRQSIPLFQEVVRRSPGFARGWASLAEANEFAYEMDRGRSSRLLTAARDAGRQAVELDPRLPEAHAVMCSILFFRDWDLTGAESACRRAVELNPRDVIAQRRLADLRRVLGRWSQAANELDRAISLVPGDPGLRLRKARLYYDVRQYKQAAEETRASLALNASRQMPSWTLALWLQGLCHEHLGQTREAEASYRAALAHDGDDMWNESALAHLLAKSGRTAEAEAMLTETERRVARGEDQNFALALIQVGLGRHTKALDSLERGFAWRDDTMLFLGLEQRFDAMRGEPRFQALLNQFRDRASPPGMAARLRFGLIGRV
ncbi:MAG: tetratricopeptide repeat protein [Bryobacteraceae bacterium]